MPTGTHGAGLRAAAVRGRDRDPPDDARRARRAPGDPRGPLRRFHAAAGDPRDEGPPVRPRKPVRDHRLRAGDRRGRLRRRERARAGRDRARHRIRGRRRADRVPAGAAVRVSGSRSSLSFPQHRRQRSGLAGLDRVETARAQCHHHAEGPIGIERSSLLVSRPALGPRAGDARRRRGRVERRLRDGLRPRGSAARGEEGLRDRAGRGRIRGPAGDGGERPAARGEAARPRDRPLDGGRPHRALSLQSGPRRDRTVRSRGPGRRRPRSRADRSPPPVAQRRDRDGPRGRGGPARGVRHPAASRLRQGRHRRDGRRRRRPDRGGLPGRRRCRRLGAPAGAAPRARRFLRSRRELPRGGHRAAGPASPAREAAA